MKDNIALGLVAMILVLIALVALALELPSRPFLGGKCSETHAFGCING